MSIQCDNVKELVEVCAELLQRGLTFEAYTITLKVTLTGGY